MEALSEYGFQLSKRLEKVLNCSVKITKVNSLVYALKLSENNLTIIYYMPEACKTECLEEMPGIDIIHIDEDVWRSKSDLLLNRIKVKVGKGQRIFARQCVVARIDKNTALEFQEEHHLQNAFPGKYRYGLFLEGELMAIAVFSGGRQMRHTENYRSFECIRFCTKQQFVVVGGLTKLLGAFIRNFNPSDIMTYVDLDWSDGRKFENTGFVEINKIEPLVFWVHKDTQKRLSIQELPPDYNSDHYYQVSNSGSAKMIKYC